MAIANVTAEFTIQQIFEAAQSQIGPESHEALRKEIARRWPQGLRVKVCVVVPATETGKSAD